MNKPEEALRNYQESLEINRQLGQKRGVAANLVGDGQVQATLRESRKRRSTSYKQALEDPAPNWRQKRSGDTLIDSGSCIRAEGSTTKRCR